MGKGGRSGGHGRSHGHSHSFGHSHSYGHNSSHHFGSHHRHHRGSSTKSQAQIFESQVAMMIGEAGVLKNIQNGVYTQTSTCQNFIGRIDTLPYDQVTTIKNLNLTIVGDLVKSTNYCCYIITLIFGVLLIFPLYFMCCNWWKRIVYPAYEISNQIYQKLQIFLMKIQYLQTFTLTIVDSKFDRNKAQLLRRIVTSKQIKNFLFQNRALAINYNGSEVDEFHQTMHQLKITHPNYNMMWREEIVQ